MVFLSAIHIFSAGSMIKDTECKDHFYYINVEFIAEFYTENF